MHIALAPFRLKAGVSEDMLVSTSDDFGKRFVQKQDGILKRILVKEWLCRHRVLRRPRRDRPGYRSRAE
jgi:hypothetical protein